MKRNNK